MPLPRPSQLIAFTVLATVVSACAPGLSITRRVPPAIDLGVETRRIAVLTTETSTASALLTQHLERHLLRDGTFTVVAMCGPSTPCGPVDAWVRAAILGVDEQTPPPTKEEPKPVTKVVSDFSFEAVRSNGAIAAARRYACDASGSLKDTTSAALLERTIDECAAKFIGKLLPRRVWESLEFDDEGELEPLVKRAVDGDLTGAEAGFKALLERNPNLAGVHHNLGVIAEARGEYEAAAQLYTKAQELGRKPLHRRGLAQLRARLADQERLDGR
jgi:hypothetical protein